MYIEYHVHSMRAEKIHMERNQSQKKYTKTTSVHMYAQMYMYILSFNVYVHVAKCVYSTLTISYRGERRNYM